MTTHELTAVPKVIRDRSRQFFFHIGTTNTSFLTMTQYLKEKGVKNNMFFLALFDPTLADVDPTDETLSQAVKQRILTEIVRNPWYFFREIVKVPVSGAAVKFHLHIGNLFLLWAMIGNLSPFLVLPRQNFKTVSACAFYLHSFAFASRNSHILFFNKEFGDAKNNLKRVTDLKEALPKWMRNALDAPGQDLNNTEYIKSKIRNNKIEAKPSGKDDAHAEKLGRGATTPGNWWDELSFMKYNKKTYMSAAPARSQASVSALASGAPFGSVITTTPNSIDDPAGAFAFSIRANALWFRYEFFDFGIRHVRKLISDAEIPFIYAEFSYKEIGRDENWFRVQCRELLNDTASIKRELLLEWPMSSAGSVFTEDQLETVKQHEVTQAAMSVPILPKDPDIPATEMVFIEIPDPNKPYIVGVDTASGQGLDYHAIVIVDPDTEKAIGFVRSNRLDDDALKKVALFVMADFFPNCIAVVERNYLGVVLLNFLLKSGRMDNRIFYLDKEKMAEKKVGSKTVRKKDKQRVYGVDTTAASRDTMMRYLFILINDKPEVFALPALASEIRTLVRTKSGKIEHRSGFHDDVLMAYLMTQYALRNEQPVINRLRGFLNSGNLLKNVDSMSHMNAPSVVTELGLAGKVSARGDKTDPRGNYVTHHSTTVDDYISLNARVKKENDQNALMRKSAAMIAALNS